MCPVLEQPLLSSTWLISSAQSTKGVKADKAVSEEDREIPDLATNIARSIKGKRDRESAVAGTLRTFMAGPKVSSPDLTDAGAWE